MNLILEINKNHQLSEPIGNILITPPLNEDYWLYRVKLYKDQAILGFSKFLTIGIGFAIEENDWNTNLPYSQETLTIYNHIKHNKKYEEISKEECIEAIKMIQMAAKDFINNKGK